MVLTTQNRSENMSHEAESVRRKVGVVVVVVVVNVVDCCSDDCMTV
jgi:hypothetical protein